MNNPITPLRVTTLQQAIKIPLNVRVVFCQSVILQYQQGRNLTEKQVNGLINYAESQLRSLERGFTGVDHNKSDKEWESEIIANKLPLNLLNLKLGLAPSNPHNQLSKEISTSKKAKTSYRTVEVEALLLKQGLAIVKQTKRKEEAKYAYYEYKVYDPTAENDEGLYFRTLASIVSWLQGGSK